MPAARALRFRCCIVALSRFNGSAGGRKSASTTVTAASSASVDVVAGVTTTTSRERAEIGCGETTPSAPSPNASSAWYVKACPDPTTSVCSAR